MRDWTPAAFYGTQISVAAPGTAYVILYPLPDYALSDAEFLVEDEEEQGMFLERIVGDVYMSHTVEGVDCAWELAPMGADYETPAVLSPFTTDWTPYLSEWANLRWWDKRLYLPATDPFPDLVDHPRWTHVDLHPRQMMGAKKNLWPTLKLFNGGVAGTLRVIHTLRFFWK